MVNWRVQLREFLLAQPAITALTEQRIFASNELPTGYKPSDGIAMMFSNRSGGHNDSFTVMRIGVQFRIFGATWPQIIAADSILYDTLNNNSRFLMAQQEAPGQQLTTQETLWLFMWSAYTIQFRNF